MVPRSFHAWAISTPTTPPPMMIRLSGGSARLVITRESQGSDSASPGIGGEVGTDPVAITTALLATTSVTVPSLAVTSTSFSPVIRACPRIRSMLVSSSHFTCHLSSRSEIIASRRFSASARSISPVTALRAPGTRRTARSASPGRSSTLLGMQAQ